MISDKKKEKEYERKIIYTNQRHFPAKPTPDIDFRNEPVVQHDCRKTFADN